MEFIKMVMTPVFLPGEFHGKRSLAGYSPQGHKDFDMTEVTYRACTRSGDVWNKTSGKERTKLQEKSKQD